MAASGFHSLLFANPIDEDASQRNWRVLMEGTKTDIYTPVFTGVLDALAAPAQPVSVNTGVSIGTYSIYGAIVFVHIEFKMPANWTWVANTKITLPFNILQLPIQYTQWWQILKIPAVGNPVINQYAQLANQNPSIINLALPFGPAANDTFIMDFWYYRK